MTPSVRKLEESVVRLRRRFIQSIVGTFLGDRVCSETLPVRGVETPRLTDTCVSGARNVSSRRFAEELPPEYVILEPRERGGLRERGLGRLDAGSVTRRGLKGLCREVLAGRVQRALLQFFAHHVIVGLLVRLGG